MLFEDIENKEKKDQKLSGIEKVIIFSIATIAKLALWRVKRAKTYGDLMKIAYFVENKIDFLENKYPDKLDKDESGAGIMIYELEKAKKELKELQ